MSRTPVLFLGLGTVGLSLGACAAVLGVDDGHPRADASIDAADDVPQVVVGDGAIAHSGESGAASDACESDVSVDDASGIFVTTDGTDTQECGTRTSPCKSIQHGIDRMRDLRGVGKHSVFVARGVYVESLTLPAGVNVFGGWDVTQDKADFAWTRACSSAATVVKAPPNASITVRAVDVGGTAKLSTLSIQSKDASDVTAGESLLGVLAAGSTTHAILVAVAIATGKAGDGANGVPGNAGGVGGGACTAGNGSVGASVGKGAGAAVGSFDESGYVPATGANGSTGGAGQNGSAAGNPTCVHCVSCDTLCGVSDAGANCGTNGTSGCGGGGGAGGGGGGGGGSSIALFAWDGAIVDVTSGALHAGDGGRGGTGGAGGPGGPGGSGVAGNNGTNDCPTNCSGLAAVGCSGGNAHGIAGTAGGKGGDGATGGAGGDGASGDSFAYVEGKGASVALTANPDLRFGLGGAAVGNGGAGKQGNQGP